jgi:hypothetical protein
MKNTILKSSSYVMAVALVLGMALSSCKPKEDAPALPPQGSMAPNFSSFGGSDGNRMARPADLKGGLKVTDSTATWGHAALNVLIWDVILYVNLAVPTGAFAESFNHDAKWDRKDEHWVWNYGFNWLVHYEAELHGWYDGDYVNWEMHISQTGGFQDVIWFSGRSHINGLEGSWVLNKDGNNPVTYIGINWSRATLSSDEFAIRFTNMLAGDAGNGNYIQAGIEEDAVAGTDRFYNIYDVNTGKTTEIKWHHLNQNGRVKNETHFGDTNWHCWDEFHVDAICN